MKMPDVYHMVQMIGNPDRHNWAIYVKLPANWEIEPGRVLQDESHLRCTLDGALFMADQLYSDHPTLARAIYAEYLVVERIVR